MDISFLQIKSVRITTDNELAQYLSEDFGGLDMLVCRIICIYISSLISGTVIPVLIISTRTAYFIGRDEVNFRRS